MKFKTIMDIEKEIEKRNNQHRQDAIRLKIKAMSDNGWTDTIELEVELETKKEVIKMIKNTARDLIGSQAQKHLGGIEILEEALLSKLKGYKKR